MRLEIDKLESWKGKSISDLLCLLNEVQGLTPTVYPLQSNKDELDKEIVWLILFIYYYKDLTYQKTFTRKFTAPGFLLGFQHTLNFQPYLSYFSLHLD